MFWKKKKEEMPTEQLSWDPAATQALEQAMGQAPVPGPLKGKVKKELMKAAEQHAQAAGHTTVTPEDLMQGLLSKMPASMQSKVEEAMSKGPEGIKDLENEISKGN